MLPSVPTASVFDGVVVVAAVALLIGVALRLVRAFRERGAPGGPSVPPLELAQIAAITLAIVALASGSLVDSDIADVVFVVGVLTTLGIGAVRWRRGERPFPTGL